MTVVHKLRDAGLSLEQIKAALTADAHAQEAPTETDAAPGAIPAQRYCVNSAARSGQPSKVQLAFSGPWTYTMSRDGAQPEQGTKR